MSILVLSLLGLMGLALVFDSDDAASEEETPDVEDPDAGLTLNVDTVTATEGDDVVMADMISEFVEFEDPYFEVAEFNLLGGDDSFSNDPSVTEGFTVNGGDGNDTITPGIDNAIANGDAGDDVLTGGLGMQLNGGAGDDVITYDTFDGLGDYGLTGASGGAGDDIVQIEHTLGWNNIYDTTATTVTGGEGSDDFLLELNDDVETGDDEFDGTLGQTSADVAQVYIEDFVPTEDTLTVDISSFTNGGNYELTDVTLDEDPRLFHSPEDDDNWYGLTLSLLAEGQTEPFEAVVHFRSAGGAVTLDDITILSGLAA